MEIEIEKKIDSHEEILKREDEINQYIQKKFNIIVPGIYLEYKEDNQTKISTLDYEDLYNFLSNFGDVKYLEIEKNIAIVIYNSFKDAYSFIYYSNINPLKNIIIRWYKQEDEKIIKEILKKKIKKLTFGEIVDNINNSMLHNYNVNNKIDNIIKNYEKPNLHLKDNDIENISSNSIGQYSYYSHFSISPQSIKELNKLIIQNSKRETFDNLNNYKYHNYFENNNEKGVTNAKYICKFFIQIEKDNDFQVVKRLIGSKGINIKRIIDYCSRSNNGYISDSIKLKLKGKGSGYKERPYGRESEEPLNLYVTSKYLDIYKKACNFVHELIINIYEEYKRFCERNGKIPISNLTIQKVESIAIGRIGKIKKVNKILNDM
jgi:hypothetical protein